ncbi:hypothetical protein QFC21_003502 [Naganishia friedmannii]|uniref:Uncharacterized protein n=1 Tax=Naganishia friedmannii TaxID=89922 RepID=A0ACC2VM16_9TREE|nr:hypothetical protein QFC21_003502 [Naganishia friedmannii]
MKLFAIIISVAAFILPLTTSAPLKSRALQPAFDSFYIPPSGWESQPVGTILNTRIIVPASLGLFPNLGLQGWQLLYRTQGANGEPLATVTTILKPLGAKTDRLLAYTFAEDGNNRKCAPSYNLQFLAVQENLIVTVESFIVYSALAQGWTITIQDYEGPNAAFIAGRLEGRGVLDGIRATLQFPKLGLTNPKIAIWGYSGGGAASGWAAALQPTYAPELNLIGVAQGGTPANLTATADFINGGQSAGFVFASIAGVSDAYPIFKSRVNELATPAGLSELAKVRQRCAPANILAYSNQDVLSTKYFTSGATTLTDPIIQRTLSDLVLGAQVADTPRVPLYVYHAVNDDIVPYPPASVMANSYCSNGATIEFVSDVIPSTQHFTMELLHFPKVIDWLKGRFDGTINPSGCKFTSISQTLLGSEQVASSVGGMQMAAALDASYALLVGSPLN